MKASPFERFLGRVFASPDLSTLQGFYAESEGWLPVEGNGIDHGPGASVRSARASSLGCGLGGGTLRLTDHLLKSYRSVNEAEQHTKGPFDDEDDDDLSVNSETLDMLCAAAAAAVGRPGAADPAHDLARSGRQSLPAWPRGGGPSQLVAGAGSGTVSDESGVGGVRFPKGTWALVDEVDEWIQQLHLREQRESASETEGTANANLDVSGGLVPNFISTTRVADPSVYSVLPEASGPPSERPSPRSVAVKRVEVRPFRGVVGVSEKLAVVTSTEENLCLCVATDDCVSLACVAQDTASAAVQVETAAVMDAERAYLDRDGGGGSLAPVDGGVRSRAVITCVASAPPCGEMDRFPFVAMASSELPVVTAREGPSQEGGGGGGGGDAQTRTITDRVIYGQCNHTYSRAAVGIAPTTFSLYNVTTRRFRRVASVSLLGVITAIAFSPDARFVITGGANGTVQVWHALTMSTQLFPLTTLTCGSEEWAVTSLASFGAVVAAKHGRQQRLSLLPPSPALTIAAGSEDGTVRLFDSLRVRTLWKGRATVPAPMPGLRASFSATGPFHLADGGSAAAENPLRGGHDGKDEAGAPEELLLEDGMVDVFDVLRRSADAVRSLSFNVDNTLLLVVSVSATAVLDAATGALFHTFLPSDLTRFVAADDGKGRGRRNRANTTSFAPRNAKGTAPSATVFNVSVTAPDGVEGAAHADQAEPPTSASFTRGVFASQQAFPNHIFLGTSDGTVALLVLRQTAKGSDNGGGPAVGADGARGRHHGETGGEEQRAALVPPVLCEVVWTGQLPCGVVACARFAGSIVKHPAESSPHSSRWAGEDVEAGVVFCDADGNVAAVSAHSGRMAR